MPYICYCCKVRTKGSQSRNFSFKFSIADLDHAKAPIFRQYIKINKVNP